MDVQTMITAGSIVLNMLAAWLWFRRREIIGAALALREAYKDNNVSDAEYDELLAKLEAVIAKS